jgi:hypothetical protein
MGSNSFGQSQQRKSGQLEVGGWEKRKKMKDQLAKSGQLEVGGWELVGMGVGIK